MRTKNSRRIGWLGCVAGVLLAALPVGADTYTWDNNTTPPAGNGPGPWDTTTAHWDNGASDVLWPNSLSDTAVFGLGGAIGNALAVVTVDAGGVQVGNITFNYTDTYIYNRYTLQTGPITLADGGTIKQISSGYAESAAVISSIIHGGAVNIGDGINNGAVRFYGANDYTGVTTVKAGAGLWLHNNSALGLASAGTVVESGGSLGLYSAGVSIASEPLTLNGTGVGGIGALHTPYFSNGTPANYNGAITLGSDARINSGGVNYGLNIGGPITGAFNLTLGGVTGMSVSSINTTGSVTFDGTGAAYVRLLTANTFTGGLIFKGNNAAAYVRVDQLTSLGPAANATVTFGPGAAGTLLLNLPNGGGGIVGLVGLNTDAGNPGTPVIDTTNASGGPILTVNNATDNTFAGKILNTYARLSLTKGAAGTLTLSGDNSYTGPTTINGGMLVAGHANALGLIGGGTGTITVNTNGTLGVAAGVTFTRAVAFNAGSGLGGSGTFVTNGVWTVPANFTLTPGLSTNAAGTLTVDTGGNTLTATNGTRLEIDFAGAAGSDQLVVNGPLNLGTANDTLVLKGAIKGRSYVIASASSLSGRFVTVDKSGLDTPNATVMYPGNGTVVVFGPGGTSIIVQ